MRIMTWNINSVRLRSGIVLQAARELDADVICLQETKTPDEHFPHDVFADAGYVHRHICGMKGYNGVAILSRVPFSNPQIHHHVGREDCRHIWVTIAGMDVHCIYIPAGGDEPDPVMNEKYKHKLDFVTGMAGWFSDRYNANDKVMAMGDFNIAPLEHDVWSHKQLCNVVSHTAPEIKALDKMQKSLGWVDVARHFVPENEKCYTWWSYRNKDWKKSNRGRRLDHVWVTEPLREALHTHVIHTEARDWEKPSDHVPVVIALKT